VHSLSSHSELRVSLIRCPALRRTLPRIFESGAKWNLDKTVVRAPEDGYVTNLALRKGARVASLPLSPVMAFIDTSETVVGVEIAQIDAR
jgi:hypothetical protein